MQNNQEKLHIEVDEEITTVIDRLRHLTTNQVAVVVPQRALLLQSIINLRLLAMEAEKCGKDIVIMTKDEDGIVFASRAGIEVQPFVADGIFNNKVQESFDNQNQIRPSNNSINYNNLQSNNYSQSNQVDQYNNQEQNNFPVENLTFNQINQANQAESTSPQNLSQNHPQNSAPSQEQPEQKVEERPLAQIEEKEQQVFMDMRAKKKKKSDPVPQVENQNIKNQNIEKQSIDNMNSNLSQKQHSQQSQSANYSNISNPSSVVTQNNFHESNQQVTENPYFSQDNPSDKTPSFNQDFTQSLSSFYDEPVQPSKFQREESFQTDVRERDLLESSGSEVTYSSSKKKTDEVNNKENFAEKWREKKAKKAKKIKEKNSKKQKNDHNDTGSSFFTKGLIIGGILIATVIIFVLIFPKTTLNIKLKEMIFDESVNLTAKIEQSSVDIERKIIPAREIKKDVIYSKSFEATGKADVDAQKAQGMITILNEYDDEDFTLAKKTRFMSEDGILFRLVEETTVPGMREVDGKKEVGKIDALVKADKVGSEGNIKATTFTIPGFKDTDKYDKFSGKSNSEMKGGGPGGKSMPVVTEGDITKAKEIMERDLPTFIQTEIAELTRDEEVLSKDALKYEISHSSAEVTPDTAVSQFNYEISAPVKALVFSQLDVDKIIDNLITEKSDGLDIAQLDIDTKYKSVSPEFDLGKLKIIANATSQYEPDFNVDKFKIDIAGKDYTEVGEIIKADYPEIEGDIEPKTFPSFMNGTISRFKKMTEILVE